MDQAYKNLAKYYDYLQREMNYEKWINWVINECPNRAINILEIGCGTGYVAERLYHLGYEQIDAFDLSPNMIDHAKNRTSAINFYCDDIRTFTTNKKYDLIICFMDTLNYITTEQDLTASFLNIFQALADHGTVLLDLHQNDNLENFDGYWEQGYTDQNVEYVWHSYVSDYTKRIIFHDFEFIAAKKRNKERHIQRIMPLNFYQNIYEKYFENVKMSMDDYRVYLTLKK